MAYQATPYNPGQSLNMNPPGTAMQGNNDWTWRYGSPSDYKKALLRQGGSGITYIPAASSAGGTTSKTVTRTVRTGSAPEKPNLPTFKGPEYDKRRVQSLTQREAAPGIRRLRESVQAIVGQPEENPNVKRMTLRSALQGYGTGLESVMAGAARNAEAKYQQELNLQREQAYNNWKAQVDAEMAAYQAAWQDYMSSGERISETTQTPGATGPRQRYSGLSRTWFEV